MGKAKDPTVEALKKAAKGLLWVSETEAELEPFSWPAGELTEERLRKEAGAGKGAAVEETTLERLFRSVPSEVRKKFDALAKALKEQLTGVKVYKVGDEPEKQVYIVGKAKGGGWAGLKTTAVET